jgi:uncharacterized protein (DUF2236 family)
MTLQPTAPPRTGRGRKPAPEVFTQDALLWDLVGQHLHAATTGSAFLLQVMHPAIGAVVGQRSTYRTDPWGRAARSFASVQTWVYGGQAAIDEGHRLRRMHMTLDATDEQGRYHHALSADPWAWVPLTAYHAVCNYSRYFLPRALTDDQLETAYYEVLRMCRILQVPERSLPPTTDAYRTYFDDMVEHVLEDHATAHQVLATAAQSPPPPWLPAPLRALWPAAGRVGGELNRLVTVGALPPAARDKLGLRWTRTDEAGLRAFGALAGRLNAQLPERVKYMPIAYHARRAARARRSLDLALANRPV